MDHVHLWWGLKNWHRHLEDLCIRSLIQLYRLNIWVEGISTLLKRWNSIELALLIMTFLVVFVNKILQRLNLRDNPPFSILTNLSSFSNPNPHACFLSLVMGLDTVTTPPPQTPFSMKFKRKKKTFFLMLHIVNVFPQCILNVLSVSNSLWNLEAF